MKIAMSLCWEKSFILVSNVALKQIRCSRKKFESDSLSWMAGEKKKKKKKKKTDEHIQTSMEV